MQTKHSGLPFTAIIVILFWMCFPSKALASKFKLLELLIPEYKPKPQPGTVVGNSIFLDSMNKKILSELPKEDAAALYQFIQVFQPKFNLNNPVAKANFLAAHTHDILIGHQFTLPTHNPELLKYAKELENSESFFVKIRNISAEVIEPTKNTKNLLGICDIEGPPQSTKKLQKEIQQHIKEHFRREGLDNYLLITTTGNAESHINGVVSDWKHAVARLMLKESFPHMHSYIDLTFDSIEFSTANNISFDTSNPSALNGSNFTLTNEAMSQLKNTKADATIIDQCGFKITLNISFTPRGIKAHPEFNLKKGLLTPELNQKITWEVEREADIH